MCHRCSLVRKSDGYADNFRRTVHKWLKAPDPSSNHNNACKKRQPTTGTWFTESDDFKKWMDDLNSFLWLHGIRMFFNDMFELYQLLMDNNSGVWQNNFMVSFSIAGHSSTT
jgi:hypothetical protein